VWYFDDDWILDETQQHRDGLMGYGHAQRMPCMAVCMTAGALLHKGKGAHAISEEAATRTRAGIGNGVAADKLSQPAPPPISIYNPVIDRWSELHFMDGTHV
jgi:hypothetical protein